MKKQEAVTFKVPEISLRTVEVPQAVTDMVVSKVEKVKAKKDDVLTRVLNYEHTPIITAAAVGFLAGVVVGFMVSPVKKGITIGSNNAVTHNDYSDDYDDFEDYEEDE
jgi:hypothetical protein